MRYLEDETTFILANFNTTDTVTIDVYRLSDNIKVINAASMTEISTTGRFKYSFSQSIATKTEYLYICTNSVEEQQGKMILGGYPDGIKDKTDNLPIDPADQSQVEAAIATRAPAGEYDTEMAHLDVDVSSRNDVSPPTVIAIRTEMDTNSTKMAPSQVLEDYKANVSNLDAAVSSRSVPNEYNLPIASLQTDLTFIRDEAGGDWQIINNQMIFSKEDGTELMRFDLKDLAGTPVMEGVFKRERVP